MTTIEAISAAADQVSAQHDDLTSAIDAEQSAETAVLESAIAAARPALRAVCSRMRSLYRIAQSRDGTSHRETIEHHTLAGLCIAGDAKASRDCPRENSGQYEGKGLYLLSDGSLAVRTWAGSWSKWQGSTDEQTSELAPISVRDAMRTWDLDTCLESLRAGLEGQLTGKAPERAKAARERAAKLASLASLAK